MQAERQLLRQTIDNMPDRMVQEVLDYTNYLETKYEDYGAPERVKVRNEEDLRHKLQEGIDSIEAGKTYAWEDVFEELKSITSQ